MDIGKVCEEQYMVTLHYVYVKLLSLLYLFFSFIHCFSVCDKEYEFNKKIVVELLTCS